MAASPLYLLDASIYIFRAWFAVPDRWFTRQGDPVNAVYGYLQFLLKLIDEVRPRKIAAAMDESLGSCFRNELYPAYKSSRVLPDSALAFQLEACKVMTESLGIITLAHSRYEADDLLAGLAAMARQRRRPVCILSRDKDLGQLLQRSEDRLWDYGSGRILQRTDFAQHYGVHPEQVVDFLALVGDPVDDIPGVPGIGKKTAALLLQRFGRLDRLLAQPDLLLDTDIRGRASLVTKLQTCRAQILLARQLVTLHRELPVAVNWQQLDWKPPSQQLMAALIREFGLGERLLRQLDRYTWWA